MRSSRDNFLLILRLGILYTLTPFTIDLYLPAFPQIAHDIGTSVGQMSLTVSLYFVGFALGQIFYGPLLDRFGRKAPLYLGLGIYIIASIGCVNATSLQMLLGFRLLSALGGSAASVAAMTMIRDVFPPKEAAKAFSMLMLVLSVSPLLAPTVGGFLVTAWGWRPLFEVLIALAVLDVFITMSLPVNYEPDKAVSLRFKPIFATFKMILNEPQFKTYVFSTSLSFAGLFVYVASSPGVFMEGFGLSARQFGGVFAFLTGGMIVGGQLNRLLLKYMDGADLFRKALTLQALLGITFFVGTVTIGFNFWGTIAMVFPFLMCGGIASPNGSALAVAPFKRNIGSASALFGCLELGIGAVASAMTGLLKVKGALPMASLLGVCATLGLVILKISTRPRRVVAHVS